MPALFARFVFDSFPPNVARSCTFVPGLPSCFVFSVRLVTHLSGSPKIVLPDAIVCIFVPITKSAKPTFCFQLCSKHNGCVSRYIKVIRSRFKWPKVRFGVGYGCERFAYNKNASIYSECPRMLWNGYAVHWGCIPLANSYRLRRFGCYRRWVRRV